MSENIIKEVIAYIENGTDIEELIRLKTILNKSIDTKIIELEK